MLIVTQKPKNLWLIGIFDYFAFAVEISTKNEYLIYRKDIFVVGEWEIFCKTGFQKINSKWKCLYPHDDQNLPLAAGINNKKLWLLLYGVQTNSPIPRGRSQIINRYQIISIDLATGKLQSYKILNFHNFMEPWDFRCSLFCSKCFNLQIIQSIDYVQNLASDEHRFIVAPNRLWLAIFGHVPFNANNFYFDINDAQKTCKFGDLNENFIETKSIWTMYLSAGNERSAEMPFICLRSGGRSATDFVVIDEFEYETLSTDFSTFFRDQNGQLFYLSKNLINSIESDILVLIKLVFDYEQKIVRFKDISTFHGVADLSYPSDTSIFIDKNIIVFQNETNIFTVINRVLTLSEIAYLTISKIPPPIKEKRFSKIFNDLFKKNEMPVFNPKKHGSWMSEKCLHRFFGIPSNIKIRHN